MSGAMLGTTRGAGFVACGDCGRPMVLRSSRHGPFYGCSTWPRCWGTHGAHPDGSPKGRPADAATRRLRVEAHAAYDRLHRNGFRTRSGAYRWMQESMGLGAADAHIAMFDADRCYELIRLVGEQQAADAALPERLVELRRLVRDGISTLPGWRRLLRAVGDHRLFFDCPSQLDEEGCLLVLSEMMAARTGGELGGLP